MSRKAGAPKGGRVHWLLWHLPRDFCGAYEIYYDYAKHNYTFARHDGRKLYDVFIVKQTSTHYWRVMYVNVAKQEYECFGYRNTRILAEYMYELFQETQDKAKT